MIAVVLEVQAKGEWEVSPVKPVMAHFLAMPRKGEYVKHPVDKQMYIVEQVVHDLENYVVMVTLIE